MNNTWLILGAICAELTPFLIILLDINMNKEKNRRETRERIEKYEKNGIEQKLIKEYFAKVDKKEKIAMKKLALKKYKTKKEFFKLIRTLEIAKAERANGFVISPTRKKFEVKDYEWGYVEFEETLRNLKKEEEERKAKIKEDVKKVLPNILKAYKGKSLDQIKSMSR